MCCSALVLQARLLLLATVWRQQQAANVLTIKYRIQNTEIMVQQHLRLLVALLELAGDGEALERVKNVSEVGRGDDGEYGRTGR